jgi:hypothetical protein
MAADMDIEMDIDMGLTDQDLAVPDIEIIPEQLVSSTLLIYPAFSYLILTFAIAWSANC